MLDPIASLLSADEEGVLAVIVGVEGPSYRPLGAHMFIDANGARFGNLSSGCIESDIATHAKKCLKDDQAVRLLYGRGSPFIDVRLPCGGGLEILLIPRPDRNVLAQIDARKAAREMCGLQIDLSTGALNISDAGPTTRFDETLQIRFEPAFKYLIFGKGPEASTFAKLVASSGFHGTLFSPDEETLAAVEVDEIVKRHMTKNAMPSDVEIDQWTAIILFFHDHEWEPPILEAALDSTAFYIGAQGSAKARADRDAVLLSKGASETSLARIRGPVGLIPSARDATTLAVSVLAETLADGDMVL